MKPREKILAAIAGVIVGAMIVYGAAFKVYISPVKDRRATITSLMSSIRTLRAENANADKYDKALTDYYGRTFGSDESEVSEEMRARLMGLLAPSGLSSEQFSSMPLSSRSLETRNKNKDRIVSRTVSIKGATLVHAVNLLYLLDAEPHVHQLDSLALTPSENGKVELVFNYSTLALETPAGHATTVPAQTEPAGSLDSPDRVKYGVVSSRDIFRPYVAAPPPPPPPPPPEAPRYEKPSPPPERYNRDDRLRIAGLPTLFGDDQVNVREGSHGEVKTYKVGQTLGPGQIVMVDYRSMPRHDNPRVWSDSRVILKVGEDYWSVELGDSLSDKRRMTGDRLPPQLKPAPASAPTATPAP